MRPSLFRVICYGRSSDEERVRSYSFVRKARAHEREFQKEMFL